MTATPSTTSTTSVAGLNADTGLGTTTVADSVIAKVAGIAAREVPGVHDLGGNVARAIGAIRGALNTSDRSQGVSVEVGETQVAVDITLIADYPVSLPRVADGVRTAVIEAIESLVGLQVTEVDVTISDVVIPSDGADADDTPARVR